MALCVPQTTETAPMGLTAPRAVSGKSSSGDPKKADNLLAELRRVAKPVAAPVEAVKPPPKIRIPPSEEEQDTLRKQRKLAASVARKERREERLKFSIPPTTIEEVREELKRKLEKAEELKENIRYGEKVDWNMASLKVVTDTIIKLQEQLVVLEWRQAKDNANVLSLEVMPKEKSLFGWLTRA